MKPISNGVKLAAAMTILFVGVYFLSQEEPKPRLVGVDFVEGTKWRGGEISSIQQLSIPFNYHSGTGPRYRATWTNGIVRHVCITGGGIVMMSQVTWEILVFDDDGQLIEHNEIRSGMYDCPVKLVSTRPVRIGFCCGPEKIEYQRRFDYSPSEWKERTNSVRIWYEEAMAEWEKEKQQKKELNPNCHCSPRTHQTVNT